MIGLALGLELGLGTPNVTDSTTAVQQTTTRCSGRTRRAPQHFGDYVTGRELENLALHCDALISSGLPRNTADALADPNWKAAMDREFKSLEEKGVWELVKPPSGQGIISGKWHSAHKLNDEGNVVKYKAQFVARGFTQTPGIDFHDTYSPTAKLSTLRTVLATCGVKLGMHFNQKDIKTAYALFQYKTLQFEFPMNSNFQIVQISIPIRAHFVRVILIFDFCNFG